MKCDICKLIIREKEWKENKGLCDSCYYNSKNINKECCKNEV